MALFSKKKKKEEKKAEPKAAEEKPVVPKPKKASVKKKAYEAWRVLEYPHVSEKATEQAQKNRYVFRVKDRTSKPEVKRAVESLYNVDVVDVNIINVPAKKRRLGRIEGWKRGYKKAIVKVKQGQKIELLPR